MKKYMFLIAMFFCFTSFSQQSKDVRKDEKKQEKMDNKTTGMEHAGGKRAARKLHKSEKKEKKLDKKSEK